MSSTGLAGLQDSRGSRTREHHAKEEKHRCLWERRLGFWEIPRTENVLLSSNTVSARVSFHAMTVGQAPITVADSRSGPTEASRGQWGCCAGAHGTCVVETEMELKTERTAPLRTSEAPGN